MLIIMEILGIDLVYKFTVFSIYIYIVENVAKCYNLLKNRWCVI